MYSYNPYYGKYLAHFGVKGMRWGVRRYQNPNGSYKKNAKGRYNEKLKKQSIETGNAKYALDNFSKYSTSELRELRDRANIRQDLKDISVGKKDKEKTVQLIKNSKETISGISTMLTSAITIGAIAYAINHHGTNKLITAKASKILQGG